jgi:putative FmdB family regulatory protein
MPVYDYSCEACGTFSTNRPMAEYREPQVCPGCGEPAPRVLLSAPHFADMGAARRTAHQTNERSAHAPGHTTGHVHGPSCGCGSRSSTSVAKSFPNARPWMISH